MTTPAPFAATPTVRSREVAELVVRRQTIAAFVVQWGLAGMVTAWIAPELAEVWLHTIAAGIERGVTAAAALVQQLTAG